MPIDTDEIVELTPEELAAVAHNKTVIAEHARMARARYGGADTAAQYPPATRIDIALPSSLAGHDPTRVR